MNMEHVSQISLCGRDISVRENNVTESQSED